MTTFKRTRSQGVLVQDVLQRYVPTTGALQATVWSAKSLLGEIRRMQDNFDGSVPYIKDRWNLNPVAHGKVVADGGSKPFTTLQTISGKLKPRNLYVGNPLTHAFSEDISSNTVMAAPEYNSGLAGQCLMSAQAAINSAEIDFGVNLAEFGSTLRMLANPIRSIAKLGNEFITLGPGGRRWSRKKIVEYLANRWMEYRYGITPLAYDVDKYVRDIPLKKPPGIAGERGKVVTGESASEQTLTKTLTTATELFFTYKKRNLSRTTWRGKLYYRVSDPTQFHRMKMGYSPYGALRQMWELVPYSWFFDWWLDLSTWISAISPNPSIDLQGACVSCMWEREITYVGCTASHYLETTTRVPLDAFFTAKNTAYERWRIETEDIPYFVPSFDAAFRSIRHAVDSLALATQSFKTKHLPKRLR